MSAWEKLVAQVEKDHGTRGPMFDAVMAAEGNAPAGDDNAAYESLSLTVIFEARADVRAYFESIGYAY
jgi:hypothetical protein